MSRGRKPQSDAQRAALDRAFREERRRKLVRTLPIMLLGGIGLGLYLWFVAGNSTIVERNQFAGTVQSWTRSQSYSGTSGLLLTVQLENGRRIVAESDQTLAPSAGAKVTVQENVYEGGRRIFVWPIAR